MCSDPGLGSHPCRAVDVACRKRLRIPPCRPRIGATILGIDLNAQIQASPGWHFHAVENQHWRRPDVVERGQADAGKCEVKQAGLHRRTTEQLDKVAEAKGEIAFR
jgi:hypothetical protein